MKPQSCCVAVTNGFDSSLRDSLESSGSLRRLCSFVSLMAGRKGNRTHRCDRATLPALASLHTRRCVGHTISTSSVADRYSLRHPNAAHKSPWNIGRARASSAKAGKGSKVSLMQVRAWKYAGAQVAALFVPANCSLAVVVHEDQEVVPHTSPALPRVL